MAATAVRVPDILNWSSDRGEVYGAITPFVAGVGACNESGTSLSGRMHS